uniref:Uncharacterized protein n=1 Tax=Cannabis sativa TaxID=3483 RepID=A0A803Q237_CANSA
MPPMPEDEGQVQDCESSSSQSRERPPIKFMTLHDVLQENEALRVQLAESLRRNKELEELAQRLRDQSPPPRDPSPPRRRGALHGDGHGALAHHGGTHNQANDALRNTNLSIPNIGVRTRHTHATHAPLYGDVPHGNMEYNNLLRGEMGVHAKNDVNHTLGNQNCATDGSDDLSPRPPHVSRNIGLDVEEKGDNPHRERQQPTQEVCILEQRSRKELRTIDKFMKRAQKCINIEEARIVNNLRLQSLHPTEATLVLPKLANATMVANSLNNNKR